VHEQRRDTICPICRVLQLVHYSAKREPQGTKLHDVASGDSQINDTANGPNKKFFVELIKPSHYDDDGYVIQWARVWIPTNSLACLYGLARDAAERKVLGDDVRIELNAYDECDTVLPVKDIIRRINQPGASGLVCIIGVQSNQFPRATDLARQFRNANIPVAIGGFHVSGCFAMLPEIPDDLQAVLDMGVTLFAGEAEGRIESLFLDAYHGRLEPVYNYIGQPPDLQGAVTPYLPKSLVERYVGSFTGFDTGRGCPFKCSFCTIINVQGHKSRYRTADDVERFIRESLAQGVNRFFVTDDNFARNKNWEPILDRLIEIRRELDGDLGFMLQVDTQAHKIPRFVDKAVQAGVSKVFLGLESVNPENLLASNKLQNNIAEYRAMAQAWRNAGIITYAGYILGFPGDSPESIARDIETIKRELPIDLLEFFCLTPLPGSQDHKNAYVQGDLREVDLNEFDLEHAVTAHPKMSSKEWVKAYHSAWDIYYTPQHMETLLRRAAATSPIPAKHTSRLVYHFAQFYGLAVQEKVHPLQCGYFRRKIRTQRRWGMPLENPLVFYPRRVWETFRTYLPILGLVWKAMRMRKRILRDPQMKNYTDLAISPADAADDHVLPILDQAEANTSVPFPLESETAKRDARVA